MRGKVGDVERRQLAEGPLEHGHAGVTGEPRREQEPVRLRQVGMDGGRQGAARRMIAVVRRRVKRLRPRTPQNAQRTASDAYSTA